MHVDRLMDQHSFNNRGAKGVFTLWHPHQPGQALPDSRCLVTSGYRCGLGSRAHDWLDSLGQPAAVEDAYDYILALLSAPSYTRTHWQALENDFLRVPLTADLPAFQTAAALGAKLRKAWTLSVGRAVSVAWKGPGSSKPLGRASHSVDRLVFASGRELTGVTAEAWKFEVSNYGLLRNWFAARQHWQPTVSQAKDAIAVVSATLAMLDLATDLDDALAEAIRTTP